LDVRKKDIKIWIKGSGRDDYSEEVNGE